MKQEGQQDLSFKLSEVSILSAHNISSKALADFYNDNPLDNSSLIRCWQWKFHSAAFGDKIPLVMFYRGRVIAHIGLMPFKISFEGNEYAASWLTDLSVLTEFHSRGAGMGRKLVTLAKEAMKFADLNVTIGNDYAINFWSHLGWVESSDTYLHRFLLSPFNRPTEKSAARKFSYRILKKISKGILSLIYKKHAAPTEKLCIRNLDQDSLAGFLKMSRDLSNGAIPLRDTAYADWRLLCSPDREKYRIVNIQGDAMAIIVKLADDKPYKYIDILWVSDQQNPPLIKTVISTLAIWGMENKYSMVRYYTSNKMRSDYLRKSLKSIVWHPRFAFYSSDKALLQKAKNTIWHWQLIDSDFELF